MAQTFNALAPKVNLYVLLFCSFWIFLLYFVHFKLHIFCSANFWIYLSFSAHLSTHLGSFCSFRLLNMFLLILKIIRVFSAHYKKIFLLILGSWIFSLINKKTNHYASAHLSANLDVRAQFGSFCMPKVWSVLTCTHTLQEGYAWSS